VQGGTNVGAGKPRVGKRERARLRLRNQHTEQDDDKAQLSRTSLRQDLPTPANRYSQREPELSRDRRNYMDGKQPTACAPAILAEMANISAADAFDRILRDPETGLPNDAELTEIYMRYERGLPLNER